VAEDPVEIAVRALARHDRSRHEIDERLRRAGIDTTRRAAALETLESIGYLDDGRFSLSRAETLAARGYGDAAIESDLESRGLARGLIEETLARLEPEAVRAERLVARHGRGPRTASLLTRRGFSTEVVEAAVDAAVAEGCD